MTTMIAPSTMCLIFGTALLLLSSSSSMTEAASSLRGRRRMQPQQMRSSDRQLADASGFFKLIDASTNLPVNGVSLVDGAVIKVLDLPAGINVQAELTEGVASGPVVFSLDNEPNFRKENIAPYALCGDKQGDYNACPVNLLAVVGSEHTISAMPEVGAPFSITFFVTDVASGPVEEPSGVPSSAPSASPSDVPTYMPSDVPSGSPTAFPSDQPSDSPSSMPSASPSDKPTYMPSDVPSGSPTAFPSDQPSDSPSSMPTWSPSDQPSDAPSDSIEVPTWSPSDQPSDAPSNIPSDQPSNAPSIDAPTWSPSDQPSDVPSSSPTDASTWTPSDQPSDAPSSIPSGQPSPNSTISTSTWTPSDQPSDAPSSIPSGQPSPNPTIAASTWTPSDQPSDVPSSTPSGQPSPSPTISPSTWTPSDQHSDAPSSIPSGQPSPSPTISASTQIPTSSTTSFPTKAPVVVSDVRYILVDSDSDEDVMELSQTETTVVNRIGFPSTNFNVRLEAVDSSVVVTGVNFVDGNNEGKAPFAYCGDNNSNYKPCDNLGTEGDHTITSTAKITGKPALTTSITFTLLLTGTLAPTLPTTPAPTDFPTVVRPSVSPAPTPAPVITPDTPAPTLPTTPSTCKVPEFIGGWEEITTYPLKVTEAQGTLVGSRLVVTGGFYNGIDNAYRKNFYLDLDDPFGDWVQMPDLPIPDGYTIDEGTTHSAPVVDKEGVYYQIGGLIGGAKPNHVPISDVYKFDFSTMEWSKMPPLPLTIFGGGAVYEESTNQLIHSFGAYTGKFADSYDTWVLDLDNTADGWIEKKPATFPGNHLAATTAKDQFGKKRHFFMGGQDGGNESLGNQVHLVEYIPSEDRWEAHADMPTARGHASWSVESISCGFILMGGTINATPRTRTTDISYYDIATDTWTEGIAQLPNDVASPVCAIYKDYVYCVPLTGLNQGYRHKIIVPN